ncbi:MAG: hypothetical protein A3J58_01045 [Candidatus Sungbacteria bacterium RIFCSPHIGHO2_02_FULL_52_23]|uniref:Methyltransferase type 11 domain-containing protein n=1 Tax=Candidatus Sungbacteria bacterium RIFCSPHIGHO2_02_FULL_52_23 TaxID=1802274 RepID=A0A1G2KXQ2_9BACT|nr:MAG: hypothetical protein A3J58_01045 [Candidatus Sungbacteria bacterium RIFCSPHIGHO2_02_FULL_52_23]
MEKDKLKTLFSRAPVREAGGKFYFLSGVGQTQEAAGSVRAFFKRWPRLYRAVTFVISDLFSEGMSVAGAVRRVFPQGIGSDAVVVNIGSGLQDMDERIITVDMIDFPSVRVIADAANLPFRDASCDMVLAVSLLEHCPEPERVIAEITRVVKPGGYVYCAVPFLYPLHGSPQDYVRFTLPGLIGRFGAFRVVAAGPQSGPVTTLIIQTAYTLAIFTSFGSDRLYSVLLECWMLLLFPLRVFDLLFRIFPHRSDAAAAIYFFGKKV